MDTQPSSSITTYIQKRNFTLVAQTTTRIYVPRCRRFRLLCDLHNIAYVSVICILFWSSPPPPPSPPYGPFEQTQCWLLKNYSNEIHTGYTLLVSAAFQFD